jgi:hypothetical protein
LIYVTAEKRLKDTIPCESNHRPCFATEIMATASLAIETKPAIQPKKLFPENIELNVGGMFFSTTVFTLTRLKDSLLGRIFEGKQSGLEKDVGGKYFIDRDGFLFRYILDYLRSLKLHLPNDFNEIERLKTEADFYELKDLRRQLDVYTNGDRLAAQDEMYGYISVHVRRTYAFGRSGQADIKFRKLRRILVCGRVSLCREVFGASLNQTRDPNPDRLRYTNRFFLKYNQIERAFTQLKQAGFELVSSDGGKVGCNADFNDKSEEERWEHFSSYSFLRDKLINKSSI